MDYRTAAAASQNIAGIANAFMQMNDPAARAKAGLVRGAAEEQNLRNIGLGIGNQFAPQIAQSGIDLTRARTTTEGSQQAYLAAGADERRTASGVNSLRIRAGEEVLGNPSAASAFTVPFTTYSQGGDAGPDELTDKWTEKGYSATGQNLTPGMAAVNPARHPIGTVFQNPETGEVFVAGDKHGNSNPDVVDLYREPAAYTAESGQMPLQVVGQEKLPYGTTPEQIQAIRDKYSRAANIFAQGGANDLAQANARNAMLAAGDDEQAGRNAAAAISGNLPGQGEYSTPAAADAFQGRGLDAAYQQAQTIEAMQQDGLDKRKVLDLAYGRTGTRGSAAGSSADISGVSMIKPVQEMVGARFGMATDAGPVVAPEMQQAAGSWQTTYANLVDNGVSPVKAEVIADQHHQIGSVTQEDPWFGSPRMEAGAGFNPIPLTPDEARAYAPAPAAGVPELPAGIASLFGGPPAAVAGPDQTTAPAPAPAQTAGPIPQTGADSLPGKRMGDDKAAAEKQAAADKGTAWNGATLGNVLRAADVMGVPVDDIIATAMAGNAGNDAEIGALFSNGAARGNMVIQSGGADAKNLRNALLDERALAAAGIDPAKVRAYLAGQPAQAPARRYNPATGKIE